ncbi:hypothetical protein QBC35DRAFT_473074 [Podospora australis]|uniref:Uncharacterized protein n=1 Tax=Podospora australis TaxID=1536484 RepID=A0AAN6WWQ8_9PEZI|nr:hypothetical protein QBC35DRAFT_473074 [Podospora australis]
MAVLNFFLTTKCWSRSGQLRRKTFRSWGDSWERSGMAGYGFRDRWCWVRPRKGYPVEKKSTEQGLGQEKRRGPVPLPSFVLWYYFMRAGDDTPQSLSAKHHGCKNMLTGRKANKTCAARWTLKTGGRGRQEAPVNGMLSPTWLAFSSLRRPSEQEEPGEGILVPRREPAHILTSRTDRKGARKHVGTYPLGGFSDGSMQICVQPHHAPTDGPRAGVFRETFDRERTV